MRESLDEVYNGKSHTGNLSALDIGSDLDQAFAEGRELYKQGKPYSYLTLRGKKKSKEWLASIRNGYAWQKKRGGKA